MSPLQRSVCGCNKAYRIVTGKSYGIPVPLLVKYKIGRLLVDNDVVAVKRCYEKYDNISLLSEQHL